jgi:hypothetical protein
VYEAPAYGDDEVDASFSAEAKVDEGEHESFAEPQSDDAEEIFVPYAEEDADENITPVIVPVEDAVAEKAENHESAEEADELEEADDDSDTYIRSGKKSRAGAVAALCVLLVILVVAGGYILKKVLPGGGTKLPTVEP